MRSLIPRLKSRGVRSPLITTVMQNSRNSSERLPEAIE
jgi:hypothetical protein